MKSKSLKAFCGTEPTNKASKIEARALRLMRKLHAITGGKPQRWATLATTWAPSRLTLPPSSTRSRGDGSTWRPSTIRTRRVLPRRGGRRWHNFWRNRQLAPVRDSHMFRLLD